MTDKTMLEALGEVDQKAKMARIGFAEIEYCGTASFCRFQESLINLYTKHAAEIRQNAEDATKYRNDGSTHADGCHTWGPKHYECAVRRLKALEQAMDKMAWPAHKETILERADEIMRTEVVG